jgi:hypothetical protein
MTKETNPNEIVETLKGLLLLLLFHVLAGVIIFLIGLIISSSAIGVKYGPYTILFIWFYGAVGFLFWQLLYVIPLTIWLQRKDKVAMRQGVIIGAVLTALVNGMAFGIFYRY